MNTNNIATENPAMRNPMEFTYAITNQTFALENHFTTAKIEDGEFPLGIYDKRFSRLTGVVIADGNNATFNIPKRELAAIIKKSDYALRKHMDSLYDNTESSNSEPLSSAYTVKFTSGRLKGKTPAEVLIDDPNNKDVLNSQYSFLKKNISKYPKNQEQMDAIVEASRLLQEGKLSCNNVRKSVIVPIYTPGFRPLTSRTREDGKSFVYDVKINWYVGAETPVTVEVSNFYAPVKKTDTGLLNVMVKDKDSEIKCSTSILADTWMDIVYDIEAQMRAFEICNYSNAYIAASKQDKKNRENRNK